MAYLDFKFTLRRSLTATSLLFLALFAFGCAPESDRPSELANNLPTRPESKYDIVKRNLPFLNDSRVSYCEIVNSDNQTYTGLRDTQPEAIASLTKIITSAWALKVLGPDYRFETEVYLKTVDLETGVYDVYLKTNNDPVYHFEKILFLISELNKNKVKKIRQLTIDETTKIFLSVLTNPHVEMENTPVSTEETIGNLRNLLNSKNWGSKTKAAYQNLNNWAALNNASIGLPTEFITENIQLVSSSSINKSDYSKKLILKSVPLFYYLKNMNTYSNNYIADSLFQILGGVKAFSLFQKKELQLSSKEMQIFTGSGLQILKDSVRKDNLATCFSIIKVLSYLRNISQSLKIDLGSVLLQPGMDKEGTFDYNETYRQAVVLKTGRLYENPAMNLAGFVATAEGLVSFVFLGHDFTPTEAQQIDLYRQGILTDIFSNYKITDYFYSFSDYDMLISAQNF